MLVVLLFSATLSLRQLLPSWAPMSKCQQPYLQLIQRCVVSCISLLQCLTCICHIAQHLLTQQCTAAALQLLHEAAPKLQVCMRSCLPAAVQ